MDKFWKAHRKSAIAKIPAAKDLLTKMLTFNSIDRIDIDGIKGHGWMQGTVLEQNELIGVIRDRHRMADKKRRQDVRKMTNLASSTNSNRPIPGIEKATLKLFPEGEVECMFGEVYTYLKMMGNEANPVPQKRYDLYDLIDEAVRDKQGDSKFDFEKGIVEFIVSLC